MPPDWYCEVNGKQDGPITSSQLKQLATEGKLQPSHPVWREGMQNKVAARTVKGLFDSVPDSAAQTAKLLAGLMDEPKQAADVPELEPIVLEPAREEVPVEFELIAESEGAFETIEETGAECELVAEEKLVFNQIQKPRNPFPAGEEGATINIVANPPSGEGAEKPKNERSSSAPPTSDKPFRVMSGGDVRGPYSLEEIRGMLRAGKLGDDTLIGVETWLPVATLGSMLGAASAASSRGGSAGDGEEFGDFEEVEDEDSEDEEDGKAAKVDDGDSLPVDDEFQIG